MTPASLTTLFVSHGAPTLPIERGVSACEFLAGLGSRYPGISAVPLHFCPLEHPRPAVNSEMQPATTHNFYGFAVEHYWITYPTPGDHNLASQVAGLMKAAGLPCNNDTGRGLDNGTWIPMVLIYPETGVPFVQFSIQGHLDPTRHLALGEALAPLRH
ncbi:MAG: class III extradiol ring-cleavage dioxygenase [Methanomicrobiales archaeon]